MSSFISKPFACADPQNEISLGVAVEWIGDELSGDVMRPVMESYGIKNFDKDEWYPTQKLLDIVHTTYSETHDWESLVAIGKKSAEDYTFENVIVYAIEDIVLAFNEAHHALHKNIHPDQGLLINERDVETLVVTNNTPWPKELVFGMLFGLVRRFSDVSDVFSVIPLEDDAHGRAVFRITWQSHNM